jgi:hypothetical protein
LLGLAFPFVVLLLFILLIFAFLDKDWEKAAFPLLFFGVWILFFAYMWLS